MLREREPKGIQRFESLSPPEEEACKNFNASISPFFSLSMTNVQMKHPPLIPNVFFSLYPMEASPFHPFLLLFPPYQMDTNCPHSDGATFTSCRKKCQKGAILFLSSFRFCNCPIWPIFHHSRKKHWRIHLPSTHTIARAQALLLSPSPFFARQCGWKRRRSP